MAKIIYHYYFKLGSREVAEIYISSKFDEWINAWMNEWYILYSYFFSATSSYPGFTWPTCWPRKQGKAEKKIKNCNFAMINRDNTYYHFRKWGFLLSDSGCLPPPPQSTKWFYKKKVLFMSSLLAHCPILNIKRSYYVKN